MIDRAWLLVLSILLVPAVPALALLVCPALVGVAVIASLVAMAVAGTLAVA